MKIPALIELTKLDQYSKHEVGNYAKKLQKLQQHTVTFIRTAVIPRSTFEQIATHANLAKKLAIILKTLHVDGSNQNVVKNKLQKTISQIHLSTEIVKPIINWYHQSGEFIKIATADEEFDNHEIQNIKGDANLIDSIMQHWSKNITLDLINKQFILMAEPILIQDQFQTESSGVALTINPSHKSQLVIKSVWGIYHPQHSLPDEDTIIVDIGTQHIINQHPKHKYMLLQRKSDGLHEKNILHYKQNQLSLDNKQISALTKMVIAVKRIEFSPQTINWCSYQGKIYLTDVKSIKQPTNNKLDIQPHLVTGQTLVAGIVAGVVTSATALEKNNYPSNAILVLSSFTPQHLKLLSKATAIVCDGGILNPQLIKQIKYYQLPTLINTRHSTKYLKANSQIIINASAGYVCLDSKPMSSASLSKTTTTSKTITKILICAGNPQKANQYITPTIDGVGLLRSEYTYAKYGVHPLHVIKSSKKQELKKLLIQTIQAYQKACGQKPVIYRTLNFTSQELKSLTHSTGYEPNEPNPLLGFRGGLKYLSQIELLDFELEVINDALTQSKSPLGLMLPFIRTPGEFKLITHHLKNKSSVYNHPHFSLYLQLNTPENVLQLKNYLAIGVDGISCNAHSLHSLLHGVDIDNYEISPRYSYNYELMKILLTTTMQQIKTAPYRARKNHPQPKTILQLKINDLSLIQMAVELGFDAITVRPDFALITKQRVAEIERESLNYQ